MNQQYLKKPTLYISDFFERNKGSYYDALSVVRVTGSIKQWLKFFLNAVIKTSKKGVDTFEKIIKLREKYNKKVLGLRGRAESASKLLEFLYSKPQMNVGEISRLLDVSYVTANDLVKDFEHLDLIREITGHSRNRIYVLHEYLSLFKK